MKTNVSKVLVKDYLCQIKISFVETWVTVIFSGILEFYLNTIEKIMYQYLNNYE